MADYVMTMIERVSRAMYGALKAGAPNRQPYVGEFQDGETTVDGRVDLVAVTRAAIEAMRDPGAEMQRVGLEQIEKNCMAWSHGDIEATPEAAEATWQAMIDAALAETTSESP